MLKSVQTFFSKHIRSDDSGQLTERAQRLAAAALLLEVSRSDDQVDETERQRIEEIVHASFDLDSQEVTTLLELATQEVDDANSLYGFTSLINQHWSIDERVHLARRMWQVAFADGQLDDHEVHLMRKLQTLLHVPHKRFIGAKLHARADAERADPDSR